MELEHIDVERKGYIGENGIVVVECELPEHSESIASWLIEISNAQDTLFRFRLAELIPCNLQETGFTHKVRFGRVDPKNIPHSQDSLTWSCFDYKEFFITMPHDHFAAFLFDKTMIALCNGQVQLDDLEGMQRKMQNTGDLFSGVIEKEEGGH